MWNMTTTERERQERSEERTSETVKGGFLAAKCKHTRERVEKRAKAIGIELLDSETHVITINYSEWLISEHFFFSSPFRISFTFGEKFCVAWKKHECTHSIWIFPIVWKNVECWRREWYASEHLRVLLHKFHLYQKLFRNRLLWVGCKWELITKIG